MSVEEQLEKFATVILCETRYCLQFAKCNYPITAVDTHKTFQEDSTKGLSIKRQRMEGRERGEREAERQREREGERDEIYPASKHTHSQVCTLPLCKQHCLPPAVRVRERHS